MRARYVREAVPTGYILLSDWIRRYQLRPSRVYSALSNSRLPFIRVGRLDIAILSNTDPGPYYAPPMRRGRKVLTTK